MRDPIEVYIAGEGLIYSGESMQYAKTLMQRTGAKLFVYGREVIEEVGPSSSETCCLTLEELEFEMDNSRDTLVDIPAFSIYEADTLVA